MGPAVTGRPAVLVYDGDCPQCRAGALWLLRRAEAGGARDLEVLPARSPLRRARYPQLTDAACARAMQLVLPDGRVVSGAEAVPELLARVPRWRWLGGLLARPGAGRLSGRACAWIAHHRLRLGCEPGPGPLPIGRAAGPDCPPAGQASPPPDRSSPHRG